MTRGPFISLDGLDGAGKSTQCRLLAEWLRGEGMTVLECADPGGTQIGQVLRDLLLEHRGHMVLPCEALLFMASRAQLTAEVIRPALEKGSTVVCDRFLLANVVYQGHAGGLDPGQLWSIGLMATGGLEPELTFVLDLPIELAKSRRKVVADRMESRAADFHDRVRNGFRKEAESRPDRIVVLDATVPVDQVQAAIRRRVQERLL